VFGKNIKSNKEEKDLKMKELLLSVTKKDFKVEYFNGTGNGGQNRNKIAAACRITHPASGASTYCQEERSQKANRERAFNKLVKMEKFQKWLRLETAKRAGTLDDIEEKVERAMQNIKIEVHDEKGRWREAVEGDFKEEEDMEEVV